MSIKALLQGKSNHSAPVFDIVTFVRDQEKTAEISTSLAGQARSTTVSVESFSKMDSASSQGASSLYEEMATLLDGLGFESYVESRIAGEKTPEALAKVAGVKGNMITAGTLGLLAAADIQGYKDVLQSMRSARGGRNEILVSTEAYGPHGSTTALDESISLENYNEKPSRDFRVVTAAYNLEAARQDLFGETLYPTNVVAAAEGGIVQVLPYIAIMKDVFHKNTGARFDTQEVNLVEAFRTPSILDDVSTMIYPVVDEEGVNAHLFVDENKVPARDIVTEQGDTLKTAPLKIGAKFDLIGISNRNQLLAGNVMDVGDTLDPAMRLKAIYVEVAGEIVRFQTDRMPSAVFQPKLVGDTRGASLAFETEDLNLNAVTVAVDQSTPAFVEELKTRNWTVRLQVGVSGSVSLSKGDTWVTASPVTVDRINNVETRETINLKDGDAAAVVASLGDMVVIGYELEARFTNTNRRQRGHLLQTRALQFRHPIPMHAPITLPLSTMDDQGPGEVVKALTVTTNVRNSANAVTRTLNYLAQLKELAGAGYDRPRFGAVEGALSAMMRPTYRYAKLDLRDAIDSIRSGDRWNDVCSAILNTARGLLFSAYRDSNLQAVFQTVTGNIDERPKFIFATDMEIANYLMLPGDNRTLGAQLEYDIVSTNNENFDGKLIIVPTRKNPVEGDILNWGQFFYVTTLVADLPISRHGQISREIAAVPFNLHINNIPFAIEIDIVGLKEVMSESLYNSKL